jgi:hypothetical protein
MACRVFTVASSWRQAFYHEARVRVNSFKSQVESREGGILKSRFHKSENSILGLTFTPKSAIIGIKRIKMNVLGLKTLKTRKN